ncbi:MAG: ATP-binding protein [Chloroflexi bacterium]|nr:ATP-binding protein [Chloroflexota bacterium]
MEELLKGLGERFGVLAEGNTNQLTVIARNTDVAVGDLFLLPCRRGPDRFYIFRTTQYANILSPLVEMSEVARNKLVMPDSYLAQDLTDEQLIELRGIVLGYAEWDSASDQWDFHRPRRLPQHLSDVYYVDHTNPGIASVVRTLMRRQLGESGLYVGDLLAGEQALAGVPIYLPVYALSHHIGVFGRTGSGKSNLMMVFLRSILEHNRAVVQEKVQGPPASIFAIDPHDEFRHWHASTGGADGIHGIVTSYAKAEQQELIVPFYYLSARNLSDDGLERRVLLSRADIVPDDLVSTVEFTEQQIAFSNQFYAARGEQWIGRLLLGETGGLDDQVELAAEYLPSTIAAVQRRVGFLRHGHTRVFTRFDPEMGFPYVSTLPDILCALEHGRVIVVETTLMNEMEQFILTTIVARVLFAIRKALRAAETPDDLRAEIRQALGNDDTQGQIGMRSLADELVRRLETGELPYLEGDQVKSPDHLPHVNVVIEEAPTVLNPQRMRFGSVFRDISRQGRKFGIGLTVVSQQVSQIDQGVLTQINTELTMSLGNENERREAIRNASSDLMGFERELQVMSRGQVVVSASYKDVPLPVQVPDFDTLN